MTTEFIHDLTKTSGDFAEGVEIQLPRNPPRDEKMLKSTIKSKAQIPPGLRPRFQEHDLEALNIVRDANLIMRRALEYSTWDKVRWLFEVYDVKQIRAFLHRYGQRGLPPVTFNYWRKLLGIRRCRHSGLPTPKGELWNH